MVKPVSFWYRDWIFPADLSTFAGCLGFFQFLGSELDLAMDVLLDGQEVVLAVAGGDSVNHGNQNDIDN